MASYEFSTEFPIACRGDDYWRLGPDLGNDGVVQGIMEISDIASYGFYCFAVVVTVPTLKGQMANKTDVVPACISAYMICSALFLVIMLLGYYGFGNLGPD